jgi:hypothetical protein
MAWLAGDRREVLTPTAAELAPPLKPAAEYPRTISFTKPGTGSAYAMAALKRAVSHIRAQTDGTRHHTALVEALGLARLVRAGLLTENEVARAVGGALVDVGKTQQEGADIVRWAVGQSAASGSLPAGVCA